MGLDLDVITAALIGAESGIFNYVEARKYGQRAALRLCLADHSTHQKRKLSGLPCDSQFPRGAY